MELIKGDCLEVLRDLQDNSVDSIVTDPPYGLSFMGNKWDYDVPSVEIWEQCLRVLKPGGHLLAFAGTRTQHRMAVRIEDAGFEIRDMIAWVYASGFPKSHNVSIAIDKINGLPHRGKAFVVAGRGERKDIQGKDANPKPQDIEPYAPATDSARQWQGWGTALKPALEPITVARKPLIGTVAENVLAHGTGGLNIDGCRVPYSDENDLIQQYNNFKGHGTQNHSAKSTFTSIENHDSNTVNTAGRWPANLIHDGSEEVMAGFPHTKTGAIKPYTSKSVGGYKGGWGAQRDLNHAASEGSAARFFYCAKASKRDRDEGLYWFEAAKTTFAAGTGLRNNGDGTPRNQSPSNKNTHPTVKPTDLMRYLVRLVTPPNGTVLDPFMGSGSTGKASVLESFDFIGIERDEDYFQIAKARIEHSSRRLF